MGLVLDELFDTSSTWIGVDENSVESKHKALMVFATDWHDALHVYCTRNNDKGPEEMGIFAMRIELREDTEIASLRSIDTEEGWELVSRAFDRYRLCRECSRAAELAKEGTEQRYEPGLFLDRSHKYTTM